MSFFILTCPVSPSRRLDADPDDFPATDPDGFPSPDVWTQILMNVDPPFPRFPLETSGRRSRFPPWPQILFLTNKLLFPALDAVCVQGDPVPRQQGPVSPQAWTQILMTEVIVGVDACSFVKAATIDYNFEIQQKIRAELYHVPDLARQDDMKLFDFMGSAEVGLRLHGIGGGSRQELSAEVRRIAGSSWDRRRWVFEFMGSAEQEDWCPTGTGLGG